MNPNLLIANAILILHALIVLFVILGFVFIWMGYFLRWEWVRNFYFRAIHLGIMAVVVLQAVVGRYCALTHWEDYFRFKAGLVGRYENGFISHWIHRLLFFQIDLWVFSIVYVLFFMLLIASWIWMPPHPAPWSRRKSGSHPK